MAKCYFEQRWGSVEAAPADGEAWVAALTKTRPSCCRPSRPQALNFVLPQRPKAQGN